MHEHCWTHSALAAACGGGPVSGVALPPVADTVLVAAVDALPARLRKKVDEAVTRFAALPVTAADGRFTVAVDDTTTVTLVTDAGVEIAVRP